MKITLFKFSVRQYFLCLAGLTVFLSALAVSYFWGKQHTDEALKALHNELSLENLHLLQQLRGCEKAYGDMEQDYWTLKTQSHLDHAKFQNLDMAIKKIQKKYEDVKEVNTLYEKILNPTQSHQPLEVHHVHMVPLKTPGHFRYSFLLANFSKKHDKLSGTLRINVQGTLQEDKVELPFEHISLDFPKGHPFTLYAFQRLEGVLKLPENMSPKTLKIGVWIQNQKHPMTQELSWPVLDHYDEADSS